MIAHLKGKLIHREPTFVVIEVGGIGYQVAISLHTYSGIKDRDDILLQTVLIVREDAHILYGFASAVEKSMFQLLISVNGVGPGTAMMVLSSMNPNDLKNAITNEEVHTLQSIKGIGAKTAQRLILELKDKIQKGGTEITGGTNSAQQGNLLRNEALSALMTLGVSRQAAEKSIDAILKKSGNTLSLEELVKTALKNA